MVKLISLPLLKAAIASRVLTTVGAFTFITTSTTSGVLRSSKPQSLTSAFKQLTTSSVNKRHAFTELFGLLSLELEKPLGIILEEVEENEPKGVKVEELSNAGSAYTCPYKDQLVGLTLTKVMGEDVTCLVFDDVMDKIINAPSPVQIEFFGAEIEDSSEESIDEEDKEPEVSYEIGSKVMITVIQEGKDTAQIEAQVGDNLRKTLLENKVELYRGMKKKFGNCGGGGQCTFCAVDFAESEGWAPRSDYEDGRIPKYPTARLACMNNIQGPATIRVE
mmetsp:Transcript_19680/g.28953  ORF Transcript_19680/g.28953 Transcript_19680/m.28953 type:complete len:277 (-) Transcript_19680:348-1178(-)|eukprot:CAMPEP_0195521460 /NCGR_PEP_ID=MMETSP0794_2-20130614/18727_1 /TAXON_ID=515487 /ORGANISM="Stephanopyxis turris, Strain CCMP 815" /LENGTH=276 /DNA_ID=CAMNT_0040651023 /DNA_START=45 /DNA_END=875 /DNA_ORIENTATION=+